MADLSCGYTPSREPNNDEGCLKHAMDAGFFSNAHASSEAPSHSVSSGLESSGAVSESPWLTCVATTTSFRLFSESIFVEMPTTSEVSESALTESLESSLGTRAPEKNSASMVRIEEILREQKELDDWLPITSSRNAKWWYSASHIVTAMVGAGVLGLPRAMAQLGWGPGVTVLVLSWIFTLFTLWQMVQMHERVPGIRFDRYHELGQYAFGAKCGLYIVVPQQLVVEVGLNIVYMVAGGKTLQKFHHTVCSSGKNIKTTYFIMIFASVHFVLSHIPNFNSIAGVSLAAAIMSLSYSTIVWAASVHKGVQPNVQYGYKAQSTAGTVFDFFGALGDVAFAYAGHNVVSQIQATIPSTPENPSKGPMWRGVVVAYIIVAFCYFPVALIGYWMFGDSVQDDIIISLEKPTWLIALAYMFVVVHMIGSYQIYAMPVFDMIETALIKKLRFKPGGKLRFTVRNIYVLFTMFVGITFPFFDSLLSFFGGLACPTTYYLPCMMWLRIYKPARFSLCWWINWICIVIGFLMMIIARIGGLRQIIIYAKTYQLYT